MHNSTSCLLFKNNQLILPGDPLLLGMSITHKDHFGAELNPDSSLQEGGFGAPRKGKKNDQAHPPIHPTAHAANLAGNERQVYEYITRRFLGCCSKDAEGWQTTVDVLCGEEEFFANGT